MPKPIRRAPSRVFTCEPAADESALRVSPCGTLTLDPDGLTVRPRHPEQAPATITGPPFHLLQGRFVATAAETGGRLEDFADLVANGYLQPVGRHDDGHPIVALKAPGGRFVIELG